MAAGGAGYRCLLSEKVTNIPGQPQNVSAAPKMSTLMRYRASGTVFPIFSCLMFDYKLLCNI